ncbi:MAG: hypothetical protein ACFB21_15635 [Opitutales bacterium]
MNPLVLAFVSSAMMVSVIKVAVTFAPLAVGVALLVLPTESIQRLMLSVGVDDEETSGGIMLMLRIGGAVAILTGIALGTFLLVLPLL